MTFSTMRAAGRLVTVIIPAYNAARFIDETIRSVLTQGYSPTEVIVVDDGSTDDTAERVRRYGSAVTFIQQPNSGGAARPRNTGLAVASGDLLLFIDADDVLAPGRIAREVDFLRANPTAGAVLSNFQHFGVWDDPRPHFDTCPILAGHLAARGAGGAAIVLQPGESTEMLLTENFGSSSPMIRREVVDLVGGYDETTIPSEDFEFFFRVASHAPVGIIPTVGWHKREHPTNLSANTPRVLARKIALRQQMLEAETVPRRRAKLKRTLGSMHFDLAYYYTGRNNGLALRHAWRSVALRRRLHPKLLMRIALDALGRDTNGASLREKAA